MSPVKIDDKQLRANLNKLDRDMVAGMIASANVIAPRGEAWMKEHAPWTDRTGNARSGLTGRVDVKAPTVRIVFAHSVPYGIWLELRWEGRYAVIMPAVKQFALQWVALLNRMVLK